MFKYDETIDRLYGIELINDTTIRKTAEFSSRGSFEWIRNLANHFIANPDPMVVPIYKFETLEELPEEGDKRWGIFKYAYEMMRLPMLSREEKVALNRFISRRYQVDHPDVLASKAQFPELYTFMDKVFKDGRYTDIHDGNFLKDLDGNYRIIDIEGFNNYPGVEGRHG